MSRWTGAPRLPRHLWRYRARGAFLALLLGLASPPVAADIAEARYETPTDRYPHGVLGDPSEYTDLVVRGAEGGELRYRWERPMVFEDVAPRLVDIDGDGSREVLVVESHEREGARFAVYALREGALIPLVSNPFIGTRFRWLAIVGAADLDGDGQMEIAYVDRPHLAKTLRVWEVRALDATTFYTEEEASLPGVTNHRIGEADIAGGIRDCGAGPEMIVADANWLRVLAVRFDGALRARELGPHGGRASFAQAMGCVE